MNFAAEIYLRSLATLSRDEIGARMMNSEREQGYTRVREAGWLDWNEWDRHTLITQDGKRIRLVALQAKEPGTGAFNRLVQRIFAHNLIPVLVEPNQSLVDWCHRHDFRSKRIGRGRYKHEIWYPRRCAS